jgi:hypothetical protein
MPISVMSTLLHTLADIHWVRITILLGVTLNCLLLKPVEAAKTGSLVSQKESGGKKGESRYVHDYYFIIFSQ